MCLSPTLASPSVAARLCNTKPCHRIQEDDDAFENASQDREFLDHLFSRPLIIASLLDSLSDTRPSVRTRHPPVGSECDACAVQGSRDRWCSRLLDGSRRWLGHRTGRSAGRWSQGLHRRLWVAWLRSSGWRLPALRLPSLGTSVTPLATTYSPSFPHVTCFLTSSLICLICLSCLVSTRTCLLRFLATAKSGYVGVCQSTVEFVCLSLCLLCSSAKSGSS